MSGPNSFIKNLRAGDYGLLERSRRVADNILRRKLLRGRACCGQYGDPGC